MTIGDIGPVLALIGVGLVAASAILYCVGRAPMATSVEAGPGAAFMLDGDSVLAVSRSAEALFARLLGPDAADGTGSERLLRFFGRAGPEAVAALRAVQRTGHPTRRFLRTDDGVPYEVQIHPAGGQIRILLHDARFIAEALAAAPGPNAAAAATPAPVAPGAEAECLLEGLRKFFEAGTMILWLRGIGATPHWAEGSLRTAQGTVGAAEVLGLIAARGRDQAGGEPAPLVGRLEVMRGANALPVTVMEAAGRSGLVVGCAVDASAAAAAERTLTRFVQTMTETFAHLTVGLAIFDRNQTLALFNPALVTMWQQEPGWLARRPALREILDRLRTARRIPEMRDYHGWRDRLLGLFDDTERADYEELWNLADGSTIRVLGRPHPHGSLALIFDDATERMRLERRNRHMDDLITSTLENLNDGLVAFAPDGTLQYVNRAFHAIWDTDPSTVPLSMHVRELSALCSQLAVETEVWNRMVAFATGEENRRAWTARISLGSGRMLGARFAPLPDGSTMALFADVTDSERIAAALRERNEALEAAEQMRSAVLDQISHRLRTPLNTIFGFGELLGNPRFGTLTAQQAEYVGGILEAAAQLLDTIGAVTEIASLQLDPLEGEEDGPGVEEVLGTTVGLLEKRAAEAGVSLSVEIGSPVGLIDCTPVRLRQIVFNLAADSLHRCPAHGAIRLSARREEDGTVEIATVETAPPGLDAARPAIDRIEINSLTLSLVRRLVASEGGALEIVGTDGDGTVRVACRFPERGAARRALVPAASEAG